MNKELNILFLGGAKRVSLAECFIRSGKAKNIQVNIFSYELTSYVPISSVGTVIVGLRWKDSEIYNHLSETIKKHNIHIVLPFVDPAISIVCKLKSMLPDVFIPCSNETICNIMFNKKSAAEWFFNAGFLVPKDYSQASTINQYPVILKPKEGSASKGITILYDAQMMLDFGNRYDVDDYLIQQYICPVTEYTVDCYVSQQGKIISVVPRVRLEVAGGEVVNTRTEKNQAIIQLSEKILNKGQFKGPITIQFLKDNDTGKFYVMEINPRFGGGVVAGILAGADTTSSIIDEWMGIEPNVLSDWKDNILITRYFKEVVFQCNLS